MAYLSLKLLARVQNHEFILLIYVSIVTVWQFKILRLISYNINARMKNLYLIIFQMKLIKCSEIYQISEKSLIRERGGYSIQWLVCWPHIEELTVAVHKFDTHTFRIWLLDRIFRAFLYENENFSWPFPLKVLTERFHVLEISSKLVDADGNLPLLLR